MLHRRTRRKSAPVGKTWSARHDRSLPAPRVAVPEGCVHVVGCPHPLRSDKIDAVVPVGRSILDIVTDAAKELKVPSALCGLGFAWVDSKPVPYSEWANVIPNEGQRVTIKVLPAGGGGGGKDVTRTLLSIVVIAAAVASQQYYLTAFGTSAIAGVAGGVAGFTTGSLITAGLVGAGVMTLGTMAVNALVPVTNPTTELGRSAAQAAEETVYSISSTSNVLDPWGSVPLALGYVRFAPKHGAKPYTEISGSDQYSRALLDWGLGPVKISDIQIGDTAITSYSDYEIQTAEGFPGTDPAQTLFTNDIEETSVGVLLTYDTPVERTTSAGVDELSVDIVFNGLVEYDAKGNRTNKRVDVSIEYRETGSGDPWTAATSFIVIAKSSQTVRRSQRVVLPSNGQYDVRLTRTTVDSSSQRIYDLCYWSVLRSITITDPIDVDYVNATSQLRMRASGQLNGTVDKVNGLVKTWCYDWDTGTSAWIERETNNPASLYRYVLQCEFNPFQRTDAQIDLDALADWHEFCETKGYTYNNVSYGQGVQELLAEIAAAGRATRTEIDGKWGVVIEDTRSNVAFDFTSTMVSNVRVERDMRQPPHALRCPFINEDTWEQDERIVYADGYTALNATIFEEWKPIGVTDADQVWKLARYHLATMYLRREIISWNTDFSHIVCTRGDLVTIAHPTVGTGLAQGRIKTVTDTGSDYTVTLDEPVTMESATDYAMLIRKVADGTRAVLTVQLDVGVHTEITLDYGAIVPDAGDLFAFGEEDLETLSVIVTNILPGSNMSATITATQYAPSVYTADSGTIPAWSPTITRSPWVSQSAPASPAITAVTSDESAMIIAADGSLDERIVVSYTTSSGTVNADYIDIQYKQSADDNWTSAESVNAGDPVIITGVESGIDYDIRIRTFNAQASAASAWVTESDHTVVGKTTPPPDVSTLTVQQNGTNCTFKWTKVDVIDLDSYVLRYSAQGSFVWEDALPVTIETRGTLVTNTAIPPGSWTVGIKAKDMAGLFSTNATTFDINVTNANEVINTQTAPPWPGTLTNLIEHPISGVLVPTNTTLASADGWDTFDEFLPSPVASAYYDMAEVDYGFDTTVRIWSDSVGALGPGVTTGSPDLDFYIDYKTSSGAYDGYEAFTSGDVTLRYAKFRLLISPQNGAAYISSFSVSSDVQERTERDENVTVAVSGTAIVFDMQFHNTPNVIAQAIGTSALYPIVSSITTTGFTVQVFDSTGTDVGGTINWTATGA